MRIDRLPLKFRRQLTELSQNEVARRIGCCQGWVSRIERGEIARDNRYAIAYLNLLREAERGEKA